MTRGMVLRGLRTDPPDHCPWTPTDPTTPARSARHPQGRHHHGDEAGKDRLIGRRVRLMRA